MPTWLAASGWLWLTHSNRLTYSTSLHTMVNLGKQRLLAGSGVFQVYICVGLRMIYLKNLCHVICIGDFAM
jgi:hypothetical protein